MCAWKVTGIVDDNEENPSAWKVSSVAPESSAGSASEAQSPYDINRVLSALKSIESSGNYSAMGVPVNNQRALGAYQVMPSNLSAWGKEAIGRPVTEEEFLSNPKLQDQIAAAQVNKILQSGGSLEDVPSIWLSGKKASGNFRRDKGTGIGVPDYIKKFMNAYYEPEIKAKVGSMAGNPVFQFEESIRKNPTAQKFLNMIGGGAGKVVNPIKSFLNGPAEYIQPALVGGAQGVAKTGRSLANLGINTGNFLNNTNIPEIQEPDFSRFVSKKGYAPEIAEISDILGQLAGGGAAFKAAKAIPFAGNEANVASNALRGFLAGFGTGEDEEGGGRLESGAIGAALSPLATLSDEAIANRMVSQRASNAKTGSDMYNNVMEQVSRREVPEDILSDIAVDKETISPFARKGLRMSMNDFTRKPSIQNGHRLQSDLGKEVSKIESKAPKDRTSSEDDALAEMKSLREKLISNIKSGLNEAGHDDLSSAYHEASKHWASKVVPYDTSNAFRKYNRGEMSPESFIEKIQEDYKFMKSPASKSHNDLKVKAFLKSIPKSSTAKTAGLSILGGAGLKGGEKIYDYVEN